MNKSTFELFDLLPDQESARAYLEDRLWPEGPKCLTCHSGERITVRKGGFYRCNACQLDFTVRTGTILGRSHIPLHKWLYSMYLLATAQTSISSMQLSREIGVQQRSAWFMLRRLREACGKEPYRTKETPAILGTVVDVVLAYRPKSKIKKARKRKKRRSLVSSAPRLGCMRGYL